jgi:dienelactone hydrolase
MTASGFNRLSRVDARPTRILAVSLVLAAALATPATAAGTDGAAPSAAAVLSDGKAQILTPPEVWSTYDPDAGALDEQVLKRWTTKTAAYKEVYFSATIDGQTARVYGIYAAPLKTNPPGSGDRPGGTNATVPAVMHLHGGGQTVDGQWLEAWTARGYAVLTCNYHGIWEDRERYTIYPETLKQGNHKHFAGKDMATVPSVRASSWYIWSAVARRALTYLRQQPEVDRERIGAFGISMGGTTMWSFAMDGRLKAACAIYGCGWNRYYRHLPRFDPSPVLPAMTDDDRVWLTGMAPEGCAPYVKCPMLFLSGSNDTHGNMDRAYQTLARLPAAIEHREAFTPRFCHHVGVDSAQNVFLWMETCLNGGPPWPKSPVVKVGLGSNGEPAATLTVDRPEDVEKVAIYYAVSNPRPMSRNWRNATAVRTDDGWRAKLPVLDAGAYLFAYANVRYNSGVNLSSNEEALVPAALGAARATDSRSNTLYDGSDGSGMWASDSPCVDPVPPERIPVPVRPAVGPGGKAGFTVDSHLAPLTYQPGDPKWRAPEGAGLTFQVATTQDEAFTVNVHEDYAWPGQRTYAAKVALKAQAGWQSVTLFPADFHEQKSKATTATAPATFARCQVLELSGPWKDRKIVFTGFRWIKP